MLQMEFILEFYLYLLTFQNIENLAMIVNILGCHICIVEY